MEITHRRADVREQAALHTGGPRQLFAEWQSSGTVLHRPESLLRVAGHCGTRDIGSAAVGGKSTLAQTVSGSTCPRATSRFRSPGTDRNEARRMIDLVRPPVNKGNCETRRSWHPACCVPPPPAGPTHRPCDVRQGRGLHGSTGTRRAVHDQVRRPVHARRVAGHRREYARVSSPTSLATREALLAERRPRAADRKSPRRSRDPTHPATSAQPPTGLRRSHAAHAPTPPPRPEPPAPR